MDIWSIRAFVTNLCFIIFGYVFPTLSSAKAILSKDDDGLREWLTYWAVFGMVMLLEEFFDFLLKRLPFYCEIKIACIFWLSLPGSQGAFKIYNYVIKPYFEQYEDDIDVMISEVTQKIKMKTSKHVQSIMWEIIFSPRDGLWPEIYRFGGFLKRFFVEEQEDFKINTENKAISAHLLKDFKVSFEKKVRRYTITN
jgi:hypothetical protein